MRKLAVLAFKEVLLTFRDIGAIIAMLVTPLVLTLAIAAAFGTGGTNTLADIPVMILNLDDGPFSQDVIDVFQSDEVEELIDLDIVTDEEKARGRVNADDAAALVIIPENFSDRILPLSRLAAEELGVDLFTMSEEDYSSLTEEELTLFAQLNKSAQDANQAPVVVEIYASPNWQISTAVVRGITTQALEQINMTVAGTNAIISRLVEAQLMQGNEGFEFIGDRMALEESAAGELPIQLEIVSPTGRSFNWLDYSAANLAVLFLMFSVTSGGRTLLAERQLGTLPRLMITPTGNLTILVGKMAGIMLTGLLQVIVLWIATSLIGAYWGAPFGVIVTILALVLAATGVGAMISAWARSTTQASAFGSAFTLIGAAISGSFFPRGNLPGFIQNISLVTPHAWGIELFSKLQSGQTLGDILPLLGGLFLLTLVYYAIASFGFRRQIK